MRLNRRGPVRSGLRRLARATVGQVQGCRVQFVQIQVGRAQGADPRAVGPALIDPSLESRDFQNLALISQGLASPALIGRDLIGRLLTGQERIEPAVVQDAAVRAHSDMAARRVPKAIVPDLSRPAPANRGQAALGPAASPEDRKVAVTEPDLELELALGPGAGPRQAAVLVRAGRLVGSPSPASAEQENLPRAGQNRPSVQSRAVSPNQGTKASRQAARGPGATARVPEPNGRGRAAKSAADSGVQGIRN